MNGLIKKTFLLCYITYQDSLNQLNGRLELKLFTSLNTFAVPIQAQHLTKAVCQVNIVGENL